MLIKIEHSKDTVLVGNIQLPTFDFPHFTTHTLTPKNTCFTHRTITSQPFISFSFWLNLLTYFKKQQKNFPSTLSPVIAPGRSAEVVLGMMEFAVGKPSDDSGTRPRVNSRGSCCGFISRWRRGKLGRTGRW